LDHIDYKILSYLQQNGRLNNVEIARRLGMSPPPCLRRMRSLEQKGLIQGYHAKLNTQALGFGVSVFVQVTLNSQNDTDLSQFEESMNGCPEVREAYLLSGEADYVLKVVSKDWEHFQKFISGTLMKNTFVKGVRTQMIMREAKNEIGIPLKEGL
jgi:DNA-binding Lrp family transcriptional regulator